ncbi:hypothetical protein ACU3L3_15660 [Priestia endophytica]|uniref:Uncharacterized protein n=1 Tax=Priestia endophytica DSM 13796 TaxID=1121089 RepID=A0A1I6BXK4_9BACI|nr:hypothetical protein [Priestia endophytica]KYG32930.1 hypothetical protein AZF06_22585 [Priestia endophytica]SFQ85623.1 hypothetical protein SAMN02745910_04431 [Priestia endophytica DSM 13796]
MNKKSKRISLVFLGVIVLFILAMTWSYSYSFFSIYKTYSYQPDSVMTKEYKQDVDNFKQTSQIHSKNDLTSKRTKDILKIFEQDWLTHEKKSKMSTQELDTMLLEVKEARVTLLDLSIQENYSKKEREYFIDSVKSLVELEEKINDIRNGESTSRRTLNTQFHNLHTSFISNFKSFTTFYQVTQEQ